MHKATMVKRIREIIENPDDEQQWEIAHGPGTLVVQVQVVNVERLRALLPVPEEGPPADGDALGVTYVREFDYERLNTQRARVWRSLKNGQWNTLAGIRRDTYDREGIWDPESSISARIRDLRRPEFGNHEIQEERHPGGNGLHRYRLMQASSA